MFNQRPYTAVDFYKPGHAAQYPEGTNMVYSNFTARSDRLAKVIKEYYDGTTVVFGVQAVVKAFFLDMWNKKFFWQPKEKVIAYYKRRMDTSLGPNVVKMNHMIALHELGYMPIEIRALPEGTLCPIKVPSLTIKNTHPDFGWLTNYVESALSCLLWKFMTAATISRQYRKIIEDYCEKTGGTPEFIDWQGHDFSFRGLSGFDDAVMVHSGHLLSFLGSDGVLGIDFLEDYYFANADEEMVGGSVPATEHSVMCMGSKENEYETFLRLMTKVYPTGIVSIVSDTWDYWKVLTRTLPALKDTIMARQGKIVVRPDSGDPVRIVCGYNDDEVVKLSEGNYAYYGNGTKEIITDVERQGSIQLLWNTFGGTTTAKGYKTLDSHIGLIYGDSITLERCHQILERLMQKGFSSDNIVFGIGSYTYEYVTRDTFGSAIKATSGEINGEAVELFKDPVTDRGTKKSAKGLLQVVRQDGKLVLLDQQATDEGGELQVVFRNGQLFNIQTLKEIRARLKAQ